MITPSSEIKHYLNTATLPTFLYQRMFFSEGVRHFHVIYSIKLQTAEKHGIFLYIFLICIVVVVKEGD